MPPVVKYIKCQDLISDVEGGVNVDSDCDEDMLEVKDELPKMKEKGEEEARAMLMIGSLSTYVQSATQSLLKEITSLLAGNPFSSTVAQTKSCSLHSNRKVSNLVWITSAQTRRGRCLLLARRKAFMFWRTW